MLNKTNNTKNSIANKYSNIIKGLENVFEKIKKELVTKKELSQDNFKVWEEKNQHLVHGFAWIATYIEALRQINKWGIELTNKNKLNEFEQLILDISFKYPAPRVVKFCLDAVAEKEEFSVSPL